MKLCLSTALTHVPRSVFIQYASCIHHLADGLIQAGHEVRYALVHSDPQLALKPYEQRARLCYLWDREMVEQADVVIADASFPSTGMGIELQIAEQKGIPIIIMFRDFGFNRSAPVAYRLPDGSEHHLQIGEGFVTLMALGLPELFKVIRYSHEHDGLNQLINAIDLLSLPKN